MNEAYTKLGSIFGGKLAAPTNTFRSAIGMLGQEPDRPEKKKEEDRGVPTHWLAEHHDRAAVRIKREQLRLYILYFPGQGGGGGDPAPGARQARGQDAEEEGGE